MSTVHEVTDVTVDGDTSTTFSVQGVESVPVTVDNVPSTVTLEVPDEVEQVIIEVPGIQGAPGVQNVYAQPNDPAVQYGWGAAQKGYIWIEVNV